MNNKQDIQLDISQILRIIVKGWLFILLFVLGALVGGFIIRKILPTKFKATTKFMVKSPMLYDRNHIYRQDWYQNKSIFGDENDIDIVFAYSHGDFYRIDIVNRLGLQKQMGNNAYPFLEKNLKLKRNDTREIELSFIDTNPKRAAQIAVETRNLLEEKHSEYFIKNYAQIKNLVNDQLRTQDAKISLLDDSIAKYRDAYGLHDFMTPVRNGNDGVAQRSGNKSNINQLEKLKTLVAEKDRIAEDRAKIASLVNEYTISDSIKSLGTFFVLQEATPESAIVFPNPIIYYGSIFVGALLLSIFIIIGRGAFAERYIS